MVGLKTFVLIGSLFKALLPREKGWDEGCFTGRKSPSPQPSPLGEGAKRRILLFRNK
jgi:hypothetical protein